MKEDPFGNLCDWGQVLDILDNLVEKEELTQCQQGLIRILRFKGNWRLREEVLKRVGDIQTSSDALVLQVIDILADDNVYFDARILAGNALMQLMKRFESGFSYDVADELKKVIEKLRSTPQPPIFDEVLKELSVKAGIPEMLEN